MAISSWSLVLVYGTWTDHRGVLLAGTYRITVPTRITNSADDIIIPAGVFASGTLNTTAGVPSLSVPCPSTDDPDIQQDGWLLEVAITFTGGQTGEKYVIEVPIANRPLADGGNGLGVNLRTIALTSQLPPQTAMYGVGVAGGLALLSEDGTSVVDADGDPIVGGGGGATELADLTDVNLSGISEGQTLVWDATSGRMVPGAGASSWGLISGKPAVIAAGATQAEARAAIGAGTSNLQIGTTGSTAAAGNDARLSDARTPLAHSHSAADVSSGTLAIGRIPTGTTSTTVALGNDSRIVGAAQQSANLSDLPNKAAARSNLDVMPTRVFNHDPTSLELAALPNPCLVVVTS